MDRNSSPQKQPRVIRLLNRFGSSLQNTGLAARTLDAALLLSQARRRSGLQALGDTSSFEGLEKLVAALNAEAQLSFLGGIAARLSLRDYLEVRLRLLDYRARHPEVSRQRIERPLVILGLPRTGTTILHELLAQDPESRAPASWEVARPLPPPSPDEPGGRRAARVDRVFRLLELLAPGFQPIHAIGARLPQECVYMLASSFCSEQFAYMFNVPSYRDWLLARDMGPAYRWHAAFLQHLQSAGTARRWVLKTPAHLACLPELLAQYPDATVVWTHRRPLHAIASFSSLTSTLRAGFSNALDPRATGAQELHHFAAVVQRAMKQRQQLDRGQFIDIAFEAICSDPMAVVEDIYRREGRTLSTDARARMRAYLAARPRHLYGEHRYCATTFGLDGAAEARLYGDYLDRYRPWLAPLRA